MEQTKTVYLDHAATSFPKPEKVIRAVVDHLEKNSASPGRSAHSLSLAASRSLFEARETIADFLFWGNRGSKSKGFISRHAVDTKKKMTDKRLSVFFEGEQEKPLMRIPSG